MILSSGRRWSSGSAQRSVHLALLLALASSFVLHVFDPHAAERNPGHEHIVIAASPAERARLLAEHRHGHEHPPAHHQKRSPAAEQEPAAVDSQVVSFTRGLGIVGVWSIGGIPNLLPGLASLLDPEPDAHADLLSEGVGRLTGIALPTLTPPPRVSS